MPIYEFQCPKCGKKFERLYLSPIVLPASSSCPDCDEISPRVISTCNWKFSPFLDSLSKGEMI